MRNHVFSLWALRPTPSTPPSLLSSHVSTGKYGAWLAVTLAVSFSLSDINHALQREKPPKYESNSIKRSTEWPVKSKSTALG